MERVCFVLHVRPEKIEEYKERHRNVWPEMRQALQSAGWGNYSLFLQPDGTLIGYVECPDSFAASQAAMEATEVNARWQAEMADLFAPAVGGRADRAMAPLEEIFHLT